MTPEETTARATRNQAGKGIAVSIILGVALGAAMDNMGTESQSALRSVPRIFGRRHAEES